MLPLAYSLSLQVRILIPFSAPETGKTGIPETETGPSGLSAPETEMVALLHVALHVEIPNLAPKPEPDME